MIAKLLVTLGVLAYALLVPILEINATHVFSPDWIPHARLHEVWQLATNSMLGVLALWLTWRHQDIRIPSLMAILITGGFLFAYAARGTYGGSMVHADGSEKLILGINGGVVVFGTVVALSVLALVLDTASRARAAPHAA